MGSDSNKEKREEDNRFGRVLPDLQGVCPENGGQAPQGMQED